MKAAKYTLEALDVNILPSIVLSSDFSFEVGDILEINDFKGHWKVEKKETLDVSDNIYFHTLKRS